MKTGKKKKMRLFITKYSKSTTLHVNKILILNKNPLKPTTPKSLSGTGALLSQQQGRAGTEPGGFLDVQALKSTRPRLKFSPLTKCVMERSY